MNPKAIVAVGEGPEARCCNSGKGPKPAVKGNRPSEEGTVFPNLEEGAGPTPGLFLSKDTAVSRFGRFEKDDGRKTIEENRSVLGNHL